MNINSNIFVTLSVASMYVRWNPRQNPFFPALLLFEMEQLSLISYQRNWWTWSYNWLYKQFRSNLFNGSKHCNYDTNITVFLTTIRLSLAEGLICLWCDLFILLTAIEFYVFDRFNLSLMWFVYYKVKTMPLWKTDIFF